MDVNKLQRLTYEVTGTVQGVFFRKYTIKQGKLLHLVGYVRNTPHNTVAGVCITLLSILMCIHVQYDSNL